MARQIKLLDGSFGQALRDEGFYVDKDPLWTAGATIEESDKVLRAYKSFLNCDVDVITTNTYHASIPLILREQEKTQQRADGSAHVPADRYVQDAISILRCAMKDISNVRAQSVKILGSIGPYGVTLRDASEYSGNYVDNIDESTILKTMTDYQKYQVKLLVENGISDILFETIPALLETKAILEAIDEFDVKVVISFSCKDGVSLRHGESLISAMEAVIGHDKVTGIGINCTDPSNISNLLRTLPATNKDIFIYPNSGFENSDISLTIMDVGGLSSLVEEWVRLGATVIGGCCGTDAQYMKHLRTIIDIINRENSA